MEFSLNSDQLMIADTAETFLSAVSDSAAVRRTMATAAGFEEQLWQQITAEMGWQMTHIPEQFDGLGLGYVELCILFERMGQNLLCAPFFSTAALGINALRLAGSDAQQATAFRRIVEQGARYSLAYSGAGRISGVDAVTAQYEMQGTAAVLNGDYHYVIDGHTAEHLVVAARNAAGDLGLFVIDAGAEGVSRKLTPGMDQTRKLAKIDLRSVNVAEADILQQGEAASQTLKNVLSLAAIALAAEQVGVADKSLALTVDYIGERKQFGRAVGSFQAMKHKAADMMSKVEAARSALYYAACIADEFFSGNPMGAELYEAASVAKAYCCDAAFFNAGCAIQMHGGVGFTWEYDVHLYFKRAKAAQLAFGDSAWHREQIATQLLGAADG